MGHEFLVGDIGGTKTLLQKGDRIERFVSKDYPSFEAILEEFGEPFDKACIGVAGPVIDNQCKVTNLPWTVASNTTMTFINDLVAMAYGIPYATQECVYTGTGWGNKALIAPGTGLGEALIINGVPISSEGGHADFAPQTDRDIALYQRLRNQGHVSWETVLHEGGALLQDDAWFFELLGNEAGNLVLKGLATGGLFIGGGVVEHVFLKEIFLKAFFNKGAFSDLMRTVSVTVLKDPHIVLKGALHYLEHKTL